MGFFGLFTKKKPLETPVMQPISDETDSRRPMPDESRLPEPESAKPESAEPESAEPESAEPESAKPESDGWESAQTESGASDSDWDDEASLSLSMSKGSVLEETDIPEEPGEGGLKKGKISSGDSISNEEIRKGDPILDIYEVCSDAIKGGMGSVWKVHHNGWNTDLAMKRPQPKFFAEGSQNRKETFIHECEAWINLGLHPNIVSCYYVREIGGVPTIFSEWMENGSLKNRIADGTLYEVPTSQNSDSRESASQSSDTQNMAAPDADQEQKQLQARLLDIAIQFARGLHYAHESKDHLIHQDVKPDNLLLTKEWEAKVADFGLAHARAQLQETPRPENAFSEDATHIAPTGGYTPAYCSPEQIQGETLTRRTDIYSWAVSVLEMYLGKRIWKKGVEAGRESRRYFGLSRVPVPESMQALLMECLAENEKERPHSFSIVEERLRKIYQEVCGTEYPREEPKAAADTADSLNNRALSFLDLGKAQEARQLWQDALLKTPDHLAAAYNQGIDQWRDGLTTYEEVVRRCEAARKNHDDTELEETWRRNLEQEEQDVSPRMIVLGGEKSGSYVFSGTKPPVQTGAQFSQHAVTCAVISPDGKRIYGSVANAVGCWDVDTLEERYLVTEEREPGHDYISKLALTPDGRFLVGKSGYGTIWAAEAATGKVLRYLSLKRRAQDEEVISFCLMPDSRHVVINKGLPGNGRIHILDLTTGEEKSVIPVVRGLAGHICASPDQAALYLSNNQGVSVLDIKSGRVRNTLNNPAGKGWSALCLSGDGAWLYGGRTASGGLLYRYKTADMTCEEIRLPYPSFGPLWVNRDGSRLLCTGSGYIARLWDMETGKLIRSFWGNRQYHTSIMGEMSCLGASGDLAVFVCGSRDKTIQIWNNRIQVRKAEWELNRAKSYIVQATVQSETEAREKAIQFSIAEGNIPQALLLLEDAEAKFDPHYFLPLRRKLMGFCRCDGLTEVTETAHFQVNEPVGLCADPKGNALALISKRIDPPYAPYVDIYHESGSRKRSFLLPDGTRFIHYRRDHLCYSASGRFLAAGNMPVILWCAEWDEPVVIRMEEGNSRVVSMMFSPDEEWLVIQGYESIGLVCTKDGAVLNRIKPIEGYSLCEVLSSRKLVFRDNNGARLQVSMIRDDSLRPLRTIDAVSENEFGHNSIDRTALSPDRSKLYVSSWMGISIWDTKTWKKIDHFESDEIDPVSRGYRNENFAISPDGSLLALGTTSLRIWSLTERRLVWEEAEIKPADVAFSPDGSALYVTGWNNSVYVYILRQKLVFQDRSFDDSL